MAFVAYSTRTPLSELKQMSVDDFDNWYEKLVDIHNKLTPSVDNG